MVIWKKQQQHCSIYSSGASDLIPPIIHQGPGNQTLARGSSAKLQCHVMGIPAPSIRWEKDGQRLSADGVHISLIENGTLHISSLQVFDRQFKAKHRLLAFISGLEIESTLGGDFSYKVRHSQEHPVNGRCSKHWFTVMDIMWITCQLYYCIFNSIFRSISCYKIFRGSVCLDKISYLTTALSQK